MKQIFLLVLLAGLLQTKAQTNPADYDLITVENIIPYKSTSKNTNKIIETNVKPSNIVYTNVINNLPDDAIAYVKKFSERTSYIKGIYKLGKTYFPQINKAFVKYNVPTEANVLIALESYFSKNVKSKANAVGYWQFIDATAIQFGLNISDSLKDERKNLDKSTKAAAKYLSTNYKSIGDWYLTVASYNCGIGNVRKAIKKTGKTKPTFFETKQFLPKETQNYVMNYISLNIIFNNYNNFLENRIQWETTIQKPTITNNEQKQQSNLKTK